MSMPYGAFAPQRRSRALSRSKRLGENPLACCVSTTSSNVRRGPGASPATGSRRVSWGPDQLAS